jgi:hypothetical protein
MAFIPTGERRLWPRRVRLGVRHDGRESFRGFSMFPKDCIEYRLGAL